MDKKCALDKIGFGSFEPLKGVDNCFYYIYKTTCLINGKIYIGARTYKWSNPLNDTYLGCGIKINKDGGYKFTFDNKTSPFFQSVKKYGVDKFKRETLLYFNSRDELLKAERIIVDENFIKSENNYNKVVGGGKPPTYFGDKNGNWGNYWSGEQKKNLSNKLKKSQHNKKSNNPTAKECYIYDLWEDKKYKLKYIREIPEVIGKKLDYRWDGIMSRRYILLKNEDENPYNRAHSLPKCGVTINVIELMKKGFNEEEIVKKLENRFNKVSIKKLYRKIKL